MNTEVLTTEQVGKPSPHESARGHVTGTARYVDDLPAPADLLHVATGGAAVAHGRITRLELDAVRASPGVVDVVTAADVPGELDVGAVYPGDPLLVATEVVHVGQPLFAVAATSQRAALQAVRRAVVECEQLPALLEVDAALAAESFVLPGRTWRHGTPADALDAAPHRHDGSLYVRGQEHFYLEGQVALALPGEHGATTVHVATQHPSEVQKLVARVLGIAMHRVEVICRRMGGGFGGKESQAAPLACLAALFATRLGRAVKYRMPRRDDMVQTGKRHDFACRYELGYDDAGVLDAARITLSAKCGHSPDLSEGIVDRAMFHAANAYHLPHSEIVGHRCRTHTVSNTAFRGFGGPQGVIAIEAALDEIAAERGLDPLDVRKRNLYRPGRERTPYGQRVKQHVLPELIDELEASARYRERRARVTAFNREHPWARKGLALTPVMFGISFTITHLNQAGALVNVFTDGSVEVSHAGTEMGQGLYTKVAQVVAEAFGLPLERVLNTATRTDKVPNGSPTAASSGSDMNGMAALDACERIKSGLAAFARDALGWRPEAIHYSGGCVHHHCESLAFAEFVDRAYHARTPLTATGFYRTPDIHFDKDAGIGEPFYYYANGAAVSEVIVDTLTGEYRVLRTDILHDAGAPLNPGVDLGQIEGGFVQGLGWLTTEELLWNDDGALISNSPANYKIPTAADCPFELNVAFYRRANPQPTIYRSKATGEPPLMLAISAWCALRDACASLAGHRFMPYLAVPATPEAVYNALVEARAAGTRLRATVAEEG